MQQASGASNETQLPRAVIRRSQAINARLAARSERQPDPADPTAPTASASAVDEATPPGSGAPAPAAAPPASPTPAVDPRESDPVYWRHRFKTIEGVLKVEREQHRTERDRFNQELTQLQEQVRSLRAAQPAPAIDLSKLFTPEQIEKHGEEHLTTIATTAQKAAREEAQALINTAIEPLKQRQVDTAAQTERTEQSEYMDKLLELVPDAVEIDNSETWSEWLNGLDEGTGIARRLVASHHHKARNVKQMVKMINRFKEETAPPTPPAPPVSPHGGGASDADPAPAQASTGLTVPTEAEIRDFTRRSATLRKGQKGYVTDEERKLFDKRLGLKFAANRRR